MALKLNKGRIKVFSQVLQVDSEGEPQLTELLFQSLIDGNILVGSRGRRAVRGRRLREAG